MPLGEQNIQNIKNKGMKKTHNHPVSVQEGVLTLLTHKVEINKNRAFARKFFTFHLEDNVNNSHY
ncbi:hypothetical protein NBRC116592_02300 [Colwellia sp. KU-HH00111]